MSTTPFLSAGRLCLSIVTVSNIVGPFLADWNKTHIYNPRWPPHAKFHNGQTMSLGVCLGTLTAYFTWRSSSNPTDSVFTAAMLGSLYHLAGLTAILYPGTKFVDPEFGDGHPQLYIFPIPILLAWSGYWLEVNRLNGAL